MEKNRVSSKRNKSNLPVEAESAGESPAENRPRDVSHHRQVVSEFMAYSGPIPHPAILKQFDDLDPGRAAKILALAEDQSRHRMHLERTVITSDIWRSWAGLASGFLIAIIFGGLGTYLTINGHEWAGGTIATTPVVGLVGAFIYGTHSRKVERREKAAILSRNQPKRGQDDSD